MTGGNGDASPPAMLGAGTGTISGSSAVSGGVSVGVSAGAGRGDGGRSMKLGKELALAGCSSADTAGSPPSPSKSMKSREVEVEGGKKKRKETELEAWGVHRCSLCKKSFKSRNAVNGHMHIHKNRPRRQEEPPKQQVHEEQDEELVSILLEFGHGTFNKIEASEAKGNSSAAVEGGAPLSASKAQKKKIHMELDLNKEAPEDDNNDDEDYGGDNEGA